MTKCYSPGRLEPDTLCVWNCMFSIMEGNDMKCNYENVSREDKIKEVFRQIDWLYSESGHVDIEEIKKILLVMTGLIYDSSVTTKTGEDNEV